MGCMNELEPDGSCSYCSYTDDMPHLQSYLAPRTVLDDRYIVGKMLSYNGEGASYICYDMIGKTKAVVREYMPENLCERDKETQDLLVNPDCLAKYKTFMSEFADMNKTLSRMRNLSHITTAMDMFSAHNTTYVVLEYVEGVSLKKFLQSNTGFLSWNQVKKLFMPFFTTLSIIHNAGIIHRGISPENIIVTTEGELKLTGFCISSIRTSNTGLSPEFYSGYTAPEQYSSLEYQGPWTDVYAVAALLYRILTGTIPPDANTRLYNDTLIPASRLNPAVPPHVSKVISAAMMVRGNDRIRTVDELVTQLFEKHSQMNHRKGATQTIPIQREQEHKRPPQKTNSSSQNRNAAANKQKKKSNSKNAQKSNKATVFLGIMLLILFLGLGIFLLYELLAAPASEEGGESSSSFVFSDTDSEEVSAAGDSSEEQIITVESQSEEDPYGVGSIMPNVVGYRYETVYNQLKNDFNIRADYFYSDSEERGIITEQSIPEGTEYDPARMNELVLKVCKGTENVPVPDYRGLSQKDYLLRLDELDIKYQTVTVYTGSVPIGYVVSTSIDVGYNINVKDGEILTVRVSAGLPQTSSSESDAPSSSAAEESGASSSAEQPQEESSAASDDTQSVSE